MTDEGLKLVHNLADKEGAVEAPTDLNLADTQQIELPDIEWRHYDNPPIKLVVTNTGHTVNVGGKWECNRSYIRDGPFKGNYVFAQMHFHWGPTDDTGSEHSVENRKLPLEMHVVHINRMYRSQEMALKEKDGVAIVTYLFEIQEEDNMDIEPIISALPLVSLPQTSTQINPVSIGSLLLQFQRDYFLYWGSVSSPSCQHVILWITCRTPLGISSQQLAKFRQVRDVNGQFVVKNYRETHARRNHTLLHVSPSSKLETTLLSVYPGHAKVQEQLKQQEERLAEELRNTAAEEPAGAFIAEEPSEKTEPLASLDAEAAAEAVSEAKAAEDADTAAEAAVDLVASAAPSTIPASPKPSSAPSGHESGTLVAAPSAQPSGARVTAPPSSGILADQSAAQSDVPVAASIADIRSAPTNPPAQDENLEECTEGILSQPSTMTTTKLYGDPSSTNAGREDGVLKVDVSQTAPTVTGTSQRSSATTSKTGSAVSRTPSKAAPSRTPSVRSGPMVGNKSPLPGTSRLSSASKGFTTVPSQNGLPKQGESSKEEQEGAECIQAEKSFQKNKTKSDLRVTLSETPMELLLDEETQADLTTGQPSQIVLSEKASATETGSEPRPDSGLVCPPCPPCPTEVPSAAASEQPPEVPFELPEDGLSSPEEPAFESTTEVPLECPPETQAEEPDDVPSEQPLEPQPEDEKESSFDQPPELQPEENAKTSCEQPPEMQPQEPEVPQEQNEEFPPIEQLDTPYEEPQDVCPDEPGEVPTEESPEEPLQLPKPADRVSVCLPVPIPGVPEAPVNEPKTSFQGPCPPCPPCPVCTPCPPCPKCGTVISREEEQDLHGQRPPEDIGAAQVTDKTGDPTGKPTPTKVMAGECPPGFTKVKTLSGGQKCPPGFKEISALAIDGLEECPQGYIAVSPCDLVKDEPPPITKLASSEPGTPRRATSSAQDKGKSSQAARNSGYRGSATSKPSPEHVGSRASQIKQAEECPPGFVKVSSRPRAPSGGTTKPSRSRSNTEDPSDTPTGSPPRRVPSGVSVGHQSGASRNQSAEVIASLTAIRSDECPPTSVTIPRSSGTRMSSDKTNTNQSNRSTKSQLSTRQVSAGVSISPGVGAVNGVAPSQKSSQMQENNAATALFIKAGEKCPPGYVLARTTAGVPPTGQASERNEPITVRSGEECPPGYVKVVRSERQTPEAGPTEVPSRTSQMNKEPVYVKPGEKCPPGYVGVKPTQSQTPESVPTGKQSRTLQEQSIKAPVYAKPGEECPPGYERVKPIPSQGQTPPTGLTTTQSNTSRMQNNVPGPTMGQSQTSQVQSNEIPIYVKPGEECPPGYEKVVPTQSQTPLPGRSETQSRISQIKSNEEPVYVEPGEECPQGNKNGVTPQSQSSIQGPTKAPSKTLQAQSETKPIYVRPGEECPPGYERKTPLQSQTPLSGRSKAPSIQMQSNREPIHVRPGEECPPGYVRLVPSNGQQPPEVGPTKPPSKTSQEQNKKGIVYVKPGEECPPGYGKVDLSQSRTPLPGRSETQSRASPIQSNIEPVYVRPGEECPPGYVRLEPSKVESSDAGPIKAPSKISQQQNDMQPIYVKSGEECPPGYVRLVPSKGQQPPEVGPTKPPSKTSQEQNKKGIVYVKPGEECPPGYGKVDLSQSRTPLPGRSETQSRASPIQSNIEPVYVRPGEECPPGYVRLEPSKVESSDAGPIKAPSKISQQQNDMQPIYVKSGEECPTGYVRVEATQNQTSGSVPTEMQTKTSQSQSSKEPVYVKPGEECPPGYDRLVPSNNLTKIPSKIPQEQSHKGPVHVKPGEECPPGYVRSLPSESTALETQATENVDVNAPIYIKEGDTCPPGYVRAVPEQNSVTSEGSVKPVSQSSKSKTNVVNSPIYVQSGEECPPGYIKVAPISSLTSGRNVNQATSASTPVLLGPSNGTAPSGVLETQDSELPVYVKPGEECPPNYVKASPSQAKAPQKPTADPSVSSQTQGKGNNTPQIGRSASVAPAVSTTCPFNQSKGAATPIYIKSGEDCPPGYIRAPLLVQDSAQAPLNGLHLQGSKTEAAVYVKHGEESSLSSTQASPTQNASPEAATTLGQVDALLLVAPGEECPPGYIKSETPSKVRSPLQELPNSIPSQSPVKTPVRASQDQNGGAGKTVESLQTVHVQPEVACPPGYQKAGNSQTKTQLNERDKTFVIGANDQCPKGYVKVCETKNRDGHQIDGQASEVQSGRKPAQQSSSNKSGSMKPRRGAESPQTPGSKVCSDEEQLPQGKRPGTGIRGRSGSRGTRPKQGDIFTESSECANCEHSSTFPNIQITCSNTLQPGINMLHNSAAAENQNYESNIEPAKRSSERMRKSNIRGTSPTGRVAAEDECDEIETQPSRKSSGRSNVRKSDTIRSFTDEVTFDNRSLSYDECPSRRSVNSVKGHDETPCHGLSCVDTIGEMAISERELMSEASMIGRKSRSRLEGSSSCRFQVEEGDRARAYAKSNEIPHRMNGSAGPSQQSLGRAASSVKVASLVEEVTDTPGDDQSEPAVSAAVPLTNDPPNEPSLEEVPADNDIRSGEGIEQQMNTVVGSRPVNESGEGAELEGDVLMSLRESSFHSTGLLEPTPEVKAMSEMAVPEEAGESAPPEAVPVEPRADKSLVPPDNGAEETVIAGGTSNALAQVAEVMPVAREESTKRFRYFQPPTEPQKPAPIPVFFNSLAVTPAVILPAHMEPSSMKTKRSPKYGSKINVPCGGNVPCHGKARKLWEQEREQWVKEETSKVLLQETSNAYQALPEKVRSELAAEAARRRKSDRGPLGPEYDIPDKRGWPFEPYESDVPLMSPIDIMCECVVDRLLAPLTFEGHFFPPARSLITNTGESVEIRTVDPNCTPVLHGGPLSDDYIFESMHFHWSQGPGADCLGGTHRVNGRRFCMEGHMIHFKSEFKSKAEALKHVGGICCVAFMLQIGGMENDHFGRMSHELYRISAPKSKAALDFNALQTFAGRACPFGYITYPGTLVGREDPVNVIWIVYTEPIDICCQNVSQFQKLRPTSSSEIPTGCVPAMDVAKRPVLRACGPIV